MLRIVNSVKVQEMYQFMHPRYKDDEQHFYFNRNADVMIEWLAHGRVFLYRKTVLGLDEEDSSVQRVKWKLARRMTNLRKRHDRVDYLTVMSPDFTFFVDSDPER